MATFITYARDLVNRGQLSLLFVPGEFCYLMLNRNPLGVPLEDRQEIGTYRHALTQAQVGELTALAEAALAEPIPESEALPGVPFVTFGTGVTNEDPRIISLPLDRPRPQSAELFDQLALRLGAELAGHPYRTLQVQAAWANGESSTEDVPSALVTLRNTGLVPVKVPNAAAAPADKDIGLSMFLRQMTEDSENFSVRLRRSEVSQVSAPGAEPGDEPQPVISLQPGEELVVKLTPRRQCYLSSGSFGGGVVIDTVNAAIPEEESVRGSIQVDLGTFAVKRKARTR